MIEMVPPELPSILILHSKISSVLKVRYMRVIGKYGVTQASSVRMSITLASSSRYGGLFG